MTTHTTHIDGRPAFQGEMPSNDTSSETQNLNSRTVTSLDPTNSGIQTAKKGFFQKIGSALLKTVKKIANFVLGIFKYIGKLFGFGRTTAPATENPPTTNNRQTNDPPVPPTGTNRIQTTTPEQVTKPPEQVTTPSKIDPVISIQIENPTGEQIPSQIPTKKPLTSPTDTVIPLPEEPLTPLTGAMIPVPEKTLTPQTGAMVPVQNAMAVANHQQYAEPPFHQRVKGNFRIPLDGKNVSVEVDGDVFVKHVFNKNLGLDHPCMLFNGDITANGKTRTVQILLDPKEMKALPQDGLDKRLSELVGQIICDDFNLIDMPKFNQIEPTPTTSIPKQLSFNAVEELNMKKELEELNKLEEQKQKEIEEASAREQEALTQVEKEEQEKLEASFQLTGSWVFVDNDLAEQREQLGLSEEKCNLTAYFYHLESDTTNTLNDDMLIGFEGGQIVALNAPTQEDIDIAKAKFSHLLTETYGAYLSSIISARYELDKVQALTLGDFKKALAGAAANVRTQHLEQLFAEIKDTESSMKAMRCGDLLKGFHPNAFKSLQHADSFEVLTREQIGYLLSAFRTLPTGDGDNTAPSLEVLYKGIPYWESLKYSYKEEFNSLKSSIKQNKSFEELTEEQHGYLFTLYSDLHEVSGEETGDSLKSLYAHLKEIQEAMESTVFDHDLQMLVKFEQWDQLDLDYHEFAVSEHPGKTLAYHDLKKGMLFALPDSDNNANFYQVHNHFNYKGVIPALIVPVNKKQDAYHSPNEEDIHLVFRGTASETQWFRNFDFRGIGKKVFSEKENDILDMVTDYLTSSDSEDVTLHISGHSLGGCDTQRALVRIMEAIADSEPTSPLRKISNVVMKSHNAPRPEPKVNRRLKSAVAKILEQQITTQFEIDPIDQTIADLEMQKEKIISDEETHREAKETYLKDIERVIAENTIRRNELLKNEIRVDVDLTHVRYFDLGYQDLVSTLGEVLIGADEDGTRVTVNGEYPPFVFSEAPFFHRKLVDITIEEDFGVPGILDRHTYRAFNKVHTRKTNWSFRNIRDEKIEEDRKRMEEIFARNYHWSPEERSAIEQAIAYACWYGQYPTSATKNVVHVAFNHLIGMIVKPLQYLQTEDERLLV